MESELLKIYQNSYKLINELLQNQKFKIEVTENDSSIYYYFCQEGKSILGFYFSKELSTPRIEINLFSSYISKSKYIIIVDSHISSKKDLEDIYMIINVLLSNPVKVCFNYKNESLIYTTYEYSCFIENKPKILIERFRNRLFIFPWQKRKLIKRENIFHPWLQNEFTIR